MFGRLTTLLFGILSGVYIDQSYNLPRVEVFARFAMDWLRALEESMRK